VTNHTRNIDAKVAEAKERHRQLRQEGEEAERNLQAMAAQVVLDSASFSKSTQLEIEVGERRVRELRHEAEMVIQELTGSQVRHQEDKQRSLKEQEVVERELQEAEAKYQRMKQEAEESFAQAEKKAAGLTAKSTARAEEAALKASEAEDTARRHQVHPNNHCSTHC